MRKKKARNKTQQISLRVSEKELLNIDKRAKIANRNRSKFLIDSALQKEITVVNFPENKEIAKRLVDINSTINKLNILAYQGKIEIVYMDKFTE